MRYSLQDLQHLFPANIVDEATDLMELGQVALPDVRQDGRLITSLIQVPGHRPYRVYVRIDLNEDTSPRIHGECSCADRQGKCEHVAAVLLRALADDQNLHGEALERALRDKLPSDQGPDRYADEIKQRLLYLLFPDPGDSTVLPLQTVSARQLNKGGFGRLTDYLPGWVARSRPPRFILREDRNILAELERLGDAQDGMQLQGTGGEQLLCRMLETGRCWLGEAEVQLHIGNPRPIAFGWEMDEYGFQYPRFESQPQAPIRLLLDGLWYIDPESAECGRLQTDLPAPLLRQLFELLEGVPPEDISKLNRNLTRLADGAPLPLLQALEVELRRGIKPRPCLRLFSRLEETPFGELWLDQAQLSFAYGERRLLQDDPHQWLANDRLIKIERDKKRELKAVDLLLEWGFEAVNPFLGEPGCYTLEMALEAWFEFQSELLPQLRKVGWFVEFDDSFRFHLLEVEHWYASLQPKEEAEWFRLSLGVQVEGERINLLPALVDLLRQFPKDFTRKQLQQLDPHQQLVVTLEDRRMVSVPLERVRLILETLFELYQERSLDSEGQLSLSRIQLTRLSELFEADQALQLEGEESAMLQELTRALRGIDRLPAVNVPRGLQARLRDYQRQGLSWLQFLHAHDLGGVLADDMGLGKTVQTLAHILLEKEQGRLDRPALVVAPTSLMVNWRREAHQFAPELRVLVLHGPKRRDYFAAIPRHDLVLTSYPLLARDRKLLLAQQFHLLVLDEAQHIKNPRAQASKVVRELHTRSRLCLTGTPLENHLGELWSLFDFLLPGLLGSDKQFRQILRNPIEKQGDAAAAERLALRLRPFMLRRTKQEVVKELPPKTEILRSVELEGDQRDLYETIRLAMHNKVREVVAEQGWARSQIMVLDALLKLRQVCCDPRLVKLDDARKVKHSAKLELLMELLPEMVEEGRRILLFSQFTGMLKLIEEAVRQVGIDYVKLTGQTRDRAKPVDRFQHGEVPLFLISLKAGGTGLNLTAADTVIHYDPWWNPAVERQATDRAHRIGQKNPVFVYKLITEGTVEEKIQYMQSHKQALADSLFQQGGSSGTGWNEEELELLFGAMP